MRNDVKAVFGGALLLAMASSATVAQAAAGDPVPFGDGLTFDPIIDARLRYEAVDQTATDADAVTVRMRSGFEIKSKSGFSVLAEAEGTLALDNGYNAFPFAVGSNQRRTAYSVVPDAENIDLNRLQLQYKGKNFALTGGRQRINLDDQRFVGSVAWRQNEQTFDAVRAEAKVGPVSLDGTYSWSQRTIFGFDAGPRQAYGGDFIFLSAGAKAGPVALKGFAYLLDYSASKEAYFRANSSQTYGVRATTSLPLTGKVKLDLLASYARQNDYGSNPNSYSANFALAEAGLAIASFKLTAGYELLGSDGGAKVKASGAATAFGFQTPMATLHKFNGWADLFLNTPVTGLQDYYAGIGWTGPKIGKAGPVTAVVTFHRFHSDRNGIHYGDEWDAQIGMKLTRQASLLAKFAQYERKGIASFNGDQDTKKFWLEFDYSI